MKTTYEISFNLKINSGEPISPSEAINQILEQLFFGLHHRGLFIEGGETVTESQMQSNSISKTLFDLKYKYSLISKF